MSTAFQSKDVWRAFGSHSMGLVSEPGHWVHLSGQVSWDENRMLVGDGDMYAQTVQILRNIENLLDVVGGTMSDVVSLTTYVTELERLADIHKARADFFSEPYPASTLVQVPGLVSPDLLIEITAVAIVPPERFRAVDRQANKVDAYTTSEGGFNL
jgi:enamine deaminase RidA (YjgF/YER057c/UK114 family)